MEITELRVYREIDGLFTELSIYGDKFLKFMGIRVSQVAFYRNSRVNFGLILWR